jgi:phosphatidate cytidylyltransferase
MLGQEDEPMSEDDIPGDAGGGQSQSGARLGSDFSLRLLSGLAMGAVVAAFVFTGTIPFAVLVVAITLLLSWEWSRLVHGPDEDVVLAVHLATAFAAAVLAAVGFVGLGLLALAIGAILAMVLSLGRNSIYAAAGVFYAGLPAIAIIWLRSDAALGLLAVVFLILVIIAADTAAFIGGRLVGGPKLWPRVSPNKTWAGLISAVVASAIIGTCFWFAVPNASPVHLGGTAAILGLVSQVGDLAESALKRRFGAKDTGALIPGHGGIMDRVDGLVAASSAAGLLALAVNVHSPARALLLGS